MTCWTNDLLIVYNGLLNEYNDLLNDISEIIGDTWSQIDWADTMIKYSIGAVMMFL